MESESQRLYGSRMDSVPCAWSRPGASAMARVISRKSSKRAIPSLTRPRSLTPRRAEQRERRILNALAGGAGKVVECAGSGYLSPHRASLVGKSAEVRYAAGIDKGMVPVPGQEHPPINFTPSRCFDDLGRRALCFGNKGSASATRAPLPFRKCG